MLQPICCIRPAFKNDLLLSPLPEKQKIVCASVIWFWKLQTGSIKFLIIRYMTSQLSSVWALTDLWPPGPGEVWSRSAPGPLVWCSRGGWSSQAAGRHKACCQPSPRCLKSAGCSPPPAADTEGGQGGWEWACVSEVLLLIGSHEIQETLCVSQKPSLNLFQ